VTKGKGYLLPSGDASEEELACCIVFYPARDEYRRALMGSLDYLATWIAWERDSEKRGQDAAASWKLANIQTWECCSMGFCDDLQTNLTDILAAITALECCGEQDISDGDWYTDPVVDGEGDVPQNIIDAGYAEDAADWDGFDSYKCMISHLAVDHVEAFFREIAPYIAESGTVFGGVGVLSALLGSMLILFGLPLAAGLILSLGVAASVWNWISKYGKGAVEDIADEIATHHDALACAIYEGDGVADSVSDFNDKVDDLFSVTDALGIKAINIAPQLKAMYSGRYDQQDIAEKLAEQGYEVEGYFCICDEEEAPPSGYHLEYPVFDLFRDYRWCQDAGSNYTAETGILQLKIEPLGNPIYDMRAVFDVLGYWGYVINVLNYDTPTATMDRGHGIYQARYGVDVLAGETYAGLHLLRLDPEDEDWAAWLSQYDFIAHCLDSGNADAIMFGQSSEAPDPYELYTWNIRIRIIVPDP
jgi:hypothetical protein